MRLLVGAEPAGCVTPVLWLQSRQNNPFFLFLGFYNVPEILKARDFVVKSVSSSTWEGEFIQKAASSFLGMHKDALEPDMVKTVNLK